MNPELFSTIGYLSVALWLGIPVLWVLHTVIRPRRWIAHLAVPLAIAALVFATKNSREYISLIQVDRTAEELEQFNEEAAQRQAILDERAQEAADISFAEDSSSDAYDTEGLDNQALQYFDNAAEGSPAQPDWREQREQQTRERDTSEDDSLEAQIGASQRREGVAASEEFDLPEELEPVYMSEEDTYLANRLNRANLKISRWAIVAAFAFLLFDYVRRLNSYRESYFPLPLPSAWANALTPPTTVVALPKKARRSLLNELRIITRRGDVFLYLTDDTDAAKQATGPMPRMPRCMRIPAWLKMPGWLNSACYWLVPYALRDIHVLSVAGDARLTDAFVFETLWYGHNCVVVDSPERAEAMLTCFAQLLADRRKSRAHTRQAVHIVWDIAQPIPDRDLHRLTSLWQATGFRLLLCSKPTPAPAPSKAEK